MKSKIFIQLILAFALNHLAWSQKINASQVPVPVLHTINTEYPAAKDIAWECTKDKLYSASFDVNGKENTFYLNANGSILTSAMADKRAIESANFTYEQIPMKVRKQIEMKCDPAQVLCVNKLQKEKTDVFEINLRDRKLFYDANGVLINEFSK
jgi:hypothetical protein